MRSKSTYNSLTDILDNISLARSFVAKFSLATFRTDTRTVYAIVRCLEIISEASRRLPAEVKDRHPDLPWQDIAGAGSVYRHGYDAVLEEILWETVHQSLEPLRLVVEEELTRLQQP